MIDMIIITKYLNTAVIQGFPKSAVLRRAVLSQRRADKILKKNEEKEDFFIYISRSMNLWKLSQDSARMHHFMTLLKKNSGSIFVTKPPPPPLEPSVSDARALGITG